MASDSLLKVIAGLVKREGQIRREDAKKAKEALKAKAEEDEEDEDEDPVGDSPPEEEPEEKPEEEPEEKPEKKPEEKPEKKPEDDGEGDGKPTGPDPTLVAQVAAIVKKEIEDEGKEKKETEVKLTGKKEKINTKPKMEQRLGRMNFKDAIRMSVTGTPLVEGYESHVLEILEDEGIKGPLGYEPFFEKGKLFVMKGQERTAEKALKNSKEVSKVPKIVGEELEADEYLAMEAVEVDGRCKGFKEALRRLTYEKIRQIKEKEKAKIDEHKGTKPHKHPHEPGEEVEIEESQELQAIMALDDAGIEAEINKKGEVVVKKKDLKKAEKALKKSFKKGGQPKMVGEDAKVNEESELQKKYKEFYAKMLDKFGVKSPGGLDDKKKKEFFAAIEKGWKEGEGPVDEGSLGSMLDKKAKKLGKKKEKTEDAASFMAAASAAKKRGDKTFKFGDPEKEYPVTIKVDIPTKPESFQPRGALIGRWKEAAFDKVRAIRSRLGEGLDAIASRELKLYIENDKDLYRQQIVPIIKNVQRKMKSGKYEHSQAPKLWLYLVDNGAKKYVKDFGGDAKKDFPKDLRMSIANEFANEYKAEIEIQGGDML